MNYHDLSEQYNMMPMPPMTPLPGPGMMPSMPMPAMRRQNEWPMQNPDATGGENFIGPINPEIEEATMDLTQDDETHGDSNQGPRGRHGNNQGRDRESRWNRNRDRDNKENGRDNRSRRRSPDRNRDRSDRSRNERPSNRDSRDNRDRANRNNRDRPSLPGTEGLDGPADNVIMPGMMPYGNNMMGRSQMDMHNMPISNMPNANMPNMMPGMNMMPNMMPGMNMMPNMMDHNMMMAQQQMQMITHQPIYLIQGVLLTPIPGTAMPRRERPMGCRTIFVGGLPPGMGQETIYEIFERFGAIDDIKLHKQGVCHVRFSKQEMVEQSFFLSGFRFKTHNQSDNEATTIFIDYALNRDDQSEAERQRREPTPPPVEPFSPASLTGIVDKIKSDSDFAEAAPTLASWLEKGECNKKNANTFYSLIQACNNQMRRLHNEKMGVDEEYITFKTNLKEKFGHIIFQFEQVAKILTAAKHKRASDHFTKQQRRNIDMWHKMTEDLENIKEEFVMIFEEEETEKIGQKLVPADKYEQLKMENDTLICELEGYRNEAHLAKDEAERKFEKFKAHFIAQQALQGNRPNQQSSFLPPLPPPPPMPAMDMLNRNAPPTPDEMMQIAAKHETKLVSMLTAFLLSHPLGATVDYLTSYTRSMVPSVTQHMVTTVLVKHPDIFQRQSTDRWIFVLFDTVKKEAH